VGEFLLLLFPAPLDFVSVGLPRYSVAQSAASPLTLYIWRYLETVPLATAVVGELSRPFPTGLQCRRNKKLADAIAALMSPADLLLGSATGQMCDPTKPIPLPDLVERRVRQLTLPEVFARNVRPRTG
jgi:hypothetical protein